MNGAHHANHASRTTSAKRLGACLQMLADAYSRAGKTQWRHAYHADAYHGFSMCKKR